MGMPVLFLSSVYLPEANGNGAAIFIVDNRASSLRTRAARPASLAFRARNRFRSWRTTL
jgi:hypothetical protein